MENGEEGMAVSDNKAINQKKKSYYVNKMCHREQLYILLSNKFSKEEVWEWREGGRGGEREREEEGK